MKVNKFSIFSLSLICFVLLNSKANASCAFINIDYASRDGNRYNEGILTELKRYDDDFDFVSFVISGKVKTNASTFSFKIPKQTTANMQPDVEVRELETEYRLDNVDLSSLEHFYAFSWSNCVIEKAEINPDKLRFIAKLPTYQNIYLPVIFGEGGKEYNFVFFASNNTVIKSFQIIQEDKVIHSTSNQSQDGEIVLTWDGKDESNKMVNEGYYTFFVEAEQIDAINNSTEVYTERDGFYHNPDWLK